MPGRRELHKLRQVSGSWPTAGGSGGWVVRGAGGVAGAPLAGRPGGRHVERRLPGGGLPGGVLIEGRHVDGRLPGVRLIEGRLIG